MDPTAPDPRILAARRRGLNAARAVSLTSLTVAALTGCAVAVTPDAPVDARVAAYRDAPARPDAVAAVDAPARSDARADVAVAPDDVTAVDASACTAIREAGYVAFCACLCDADPQCWAHGCGAWGPFMPPELDAAV